MPKPTVFISKRNLLITYSTFEALKRSLQGRLWQFFDSFTLESELSPDDVQPLCFFSGTTLPAIIAPLAQRNKFASVLAASTSFISSCFRPSLQAEEPPFSIATCSTAFALLDRLIGESMRVPDAKLESTNFADDEVSLVNLSLSNMTFT